MTEINKVTLENGEEVTPETPGVVTELEDGIGDIDKATIPAKPEEADEEQITGLAADEEDDTPVV